MIDQPAIQKKTWEMRDLRRFIPFLHYGLRFWNLNLYYKQFTELRKLSLFPLKYIFMAFIAIPFFINHVLKYLIRV